jgi:hypothetical protein
LHQTGDDLAQPAQGRTRNAAKAACRFGQRMLAALRGDTADDALRQIANVIEFDGGLSDRHDKPQIVGHWLPPRDQ